MVSKSIRYFIDAEGDIEYPFIWFLKRGKLYIDKSSWAKNKTNIKSAYSTLKGLKAVIKVREVSAAELALIKLTTSYENRKI